MLAYARLLVWEAQWHEGRGWLDYDCIFWQQALYYGKPYFQRHRHVIILRRTQRTRGICSKSYSLRTHFRTNMQWIWLALKVPGDEQQKDFGSMYRRALYKTIMSKEVRRWTNDKTLGCGLTHIVVNRGTSDSRSEAPLRGYEYWRATWLPLSLLDFAEHPVQLVVRNGDKLMFNW